MGSNSSFGTYQFPILVFLCLNYLTVGTTASGGSDGKVSTYNVGDLGSIPVSNSPGVLFSWPFPCFMLYSKAKLACYSGYLLTSYFCIPVPYDEEVEKAMAPHPSTLAWKNPMDGGAW